MGKIRQDFIAECKQKILDDIATLDDKEKKILKYLESIGHGVSLNEVITKCLLMKQSGGTDSRIRVSMKKLSNIELCNMKNKGKYNNELRSKITNLLGNHKATEKEIESLYNHIIMELL